MVIKTTTGKVSLLENGIVKLEFESKIKVGMEESIDIYNARLKLNTKNKKQLLLTDVTTGPNPNIEARNYSNSEDVTSITLALAILIGNPFSTVVGNFFIGMNKPSFPTKLFTQEKKAIAWLNNMRDKA